MKKLLTLGAAALMTVSTAAFAEDAPAKGDSGPGHHKGDMMKELDTDGNGAISKAEFVAFHEKRFDEMDADKDGSISKEEGEANRAKWKEKMKEWKAKKGAEGKDAPAEAPAETPAEEPAE